MSQAALCQAVKDRIVAALPLTNDANMECNVMLDGTPHPMAGEQFVAVWPGAWRILSKQLDHIHEEYGVNVTVSRKLSQAPKDKWGTEVWQKALTGMEPIVRKIIVAVHGNYANLFAAWATALGNDADNSLAVTLSCQQVGPLEFKGADWFSAQHEGMAGVAQTITFGGAERIQNIDGPPT